MKVNLRERLMGIQTRVKALHGVTAVPGALAGLDQAFEKALNQTDEEKQRLMKLMERARNKDIEAVRELNGLRTTTVDLYVRAMSNFIAFFRPVTLQPNEQACFNHTYRNPVNVRYVGQDGGPRTVKAVRAQKQLFIDMRELHTDSYGYQIRDINLGTDVIAAAQATVDVGWDMANKVDTEAYTLLKTGNSINGTGILGAFTVTGTKLARVYIPNARIDTSNLPTTNVISLSDNGTGAGQSRKFRLNVCRNILKYCESWGNIFGFNVRPTGEILVPSSEVSDLASEITPTSLIFPNKVADGLLGNYTEFDYMNVRWKLVPDVTLSAGACYPVLNHPVGEVYLKPSLDEEFTETDRKKNWEERSQMKVINFAVPDPWRVFFLQVKYSDLA